MGPAHTRRPDRQWIAIGSVGLILLAAFVAPARAGTSCSDLAEWIDSALDDGRIPVRRAAMVWTGSEALIWGGEIGYRFDPMTFGWSSMSRVGAPDGYGPVYAWTGTELLVWGGTLSSATNVVTMSGGRYDPATDSWSPINPSGAPTGRRDAASVWTGTEWMIWGGREADGTRLKDGALYDPVSDSWRAIPSGPGGSLSPIERYGHALTWADGEVLLVGGQDSRLFSFDPVAIEWTFLTYVDYPRTFPATAWNGTELLIYGGTLSTSSTWLNTGLRYDRAGDSWSNTSMVGAPAVGTSTRAAWSGSEFLVFSGDDAASGRYDPAANSWAPMTATGSPASRSLHSVAWLGDRLMVWGGGLADGGTWDPVADAWTATDPPLPTRPMRNQTGLWTGSEVLFWGGQVDADHSAASGYRYDPSSDSWAPITSVGAPTARRFHTAVWTGSEMIVWGGQSPSTTSIRYDDGGRYDPAGDSWSSMTAVGAPVERTHFAAVWTGSEMIVWGGWTGAGTAVTDTGGRYDPATDSWTPMSTVNAPPGTRDLQMVWTGSRAIVWSGADSSGTPPTYPSTGGSYDPVTDQWSPIADAATAGIAGRMMAAAVWTGTEMIVWGGLGDPLTLATGGRYDPASDTWTATTTLGAPRDRRKTIGVWTGSRLLVYGGQSGDYPTTEAWLGDGGFYDPGTDSWAPLPTEPAIGPRSLHAGAWTGDRFVAFGGMSSGGEHNVGGVLYVGADADDDDVCDPVDNCPGLYNPDQAEFDADGFGDACDVCPTTPDPGQFDSDGDGTGDACSRCSDPDGDGACDQPAATTGDRCPTLFNPDQSGRKILLSGSPFDGLEVIGSYLRRAADGSPLIVYEGDLVSDSLFDLHVQRPLEDLALTSLGAAAAAPSGFFLDGVYEDRALFYGQLPELYLHGVSLEGGSPPNLMDFLPAGYQISRRGRTALFPWTTLDYPCDTSAYYYNSLARVDTVTGNAHCHGVDSADQELFDWQVTTDGSWLLSAYRDHNSSVGGLLFASHLDEPTGGTLQATTLPGDIYIPSSFPVRDDGLALIHQFWAEPDYLNDIVGLRVGGSVRTLSIDLDPIGSVFFSDKGDRVAILERFLIHVPETHIETRLVVADLLGGAGIVIEDPSFETIANVEFSPGESHFAYTDGSMADLYVSPVTPGGPVTAISTGGNTVSDLGFTDDGSMLVFVEWRPDGALELWTVPTTGGSPVQVGPTPQTGSPGVDDWSEDAGRLIVLGRFEGSVARLFSAAPDGSDWRPILFPDPSASVDAYWVGFDGGIVARLEGSTDLWLAPAAGGQASRLTLPGIEDGVSDPQVAENGSFLIYDAQIAGGDRETVIYFADAQDRDLDGIVDLCDCLPDDPAVGQSPGLVDLRFDGPTELTWGLGDASDAWTVYRGDLALAPGDVGSCLVEGHPAPNYSDATEPASGATWLYLVAGENACGRGEVAPPSGGGTRNVSCP